MVAQQRQSRVVVVPLSIWTDLAEIGNSSTNLLPVTVTRIGNCIQCIETYSTTLLRLRAI